jgi:hypothetical protein
MTQHKLEKLRAVTAKHACQLAYVSKPLVNSCWLQRFLVSCHGQPAHATNAVFF